MEKQDGYRRRLFCTVSVVRMAIWGKRIVLWRTWNGKEVGFVGPRDYVPMPLFLGREAAYLWSELLAARKDGKKHWLEQRRDSGN